MSQEMNRDLAGSIEVVYSALIFASCLKKLTNLYLWQTKATEAGVAKLKKALTKANIDRGFEEPPPAPKPEAKKEAKKEEKKAEKPAPKKEEKKEEKKKNEKKKDEKKKDEKKTDKK